MTIAEIEKMCSSEDYIVRLEAVKLCQGRDDVPLSLIERFYEDEDYVVRLEAVKLCQGRDDVPLSLIERFYEDEDWMVCLEGVRLCQGRDDVPLSLIERFYEEWGTPRVMVNLIEGSEYAKYIYAISVISEYIHNVIDKNPGGESWWTDHHGTQYSDDVGYFYQMWEHIKESFGVNKEEETK